MAVMKYYWIFKRLCVLWQCRDGIMTGKVRQRRDET
jgi:hypothetical protein